MESDIGEREGIAMPEGEIHTCFPVPGRGERHILVVDDDQVVREYLECVLVENGYRVATAEDFNEAKAALSRWKYDLMIIDLQFLGHTYSGLDISNYAVSVHPDCRVIILTSYPSTHSAIAALRLQAVDYLTKPVGSGEIVNAVAHALNSSSRNGVTAQVTTGTSLSKREVEVLHYLFKGFNFSEVAENIGCSLSTAKTYGRRIYKKLEVNSCTEAIYEAIQRGLIPPPR